VRSEHGVVAHLSDLHHHKRIRTLAGIFFCFLVCEKLLSGFSYDTAFYFSFSLADGISVAVYFATAVLLLTGVRKQYLLIPDFVLLGVKVYTVIHEVVLLISEGVSAVKIEHIAESVLFCTFLIILFTGKLSHKRTPFHHRYPIYCICILILCFAVTFGIELGVYLTHIVDTTTPFAHTFAFMKNVLNEAFLDLPYFLLVVTACYIPRPRHALRK